jgi:hypothetical protein
VQSLCVDGSPSEFFKIADQAASTAFHNSALWLRSHPMSGWLWKDMQRRLRPVNGSYGQSSAPLSFKCTSENGMACRQTRLA